MPANFQKSAMHLIDYILINCCNARWEFLIFLWRSMKYLDSNTFGKGQARWSSCMQWSNPKKHLGKQRLPFEDCMQWWYNLITFQREGVFGSESVMRLFDKNHGWSVTWRGRKEEGSANLVAFTRSGIVELLQNCQNEWKWDKRREKISEKSKIKKWKISNIIEHREIRSYAEESSKL